MRELTVGLNLTAGTSNTVYTVPKGCKAIATLLFLSNAGGNSKSISADWYDKSADDDIVIAGGKSVSAGEYIQFSDGRLVLDEYDEIRVTPEAASTFSVILTMEIHQSTAYQNGS